MNIMREVSVNEITKNIKEMCIQANHFLSEDMIKKLRLAVQEFIHIQKENEETIREFLLHYLSAEEILSITSNANESLTNQLSSKLSDPEVGNKVAKITMGHVANKLNGEGAQILLGGIGGMLRGLGGAAAAIFGGNIVGKLLGQLQEPAEKFLANNINDMLKHNSSQIVSNMVSDEVEVFLSKKVCVFLEEHEEQFSQAVNTIESIYCTIIQEHLPQIIDTIDISKIVRERINEMDVNETEKLILMVVDKELKAIVWLGAGLGTLIGCLNLLI